MKMCAYPALAALGIFAALSTGSAVADNTSAAAKEEVVAFTEAFLSDPANIGIGKEVWEEQCRHCHGKSAYPGKAPKLKPRRYTPEFVYKRVTFGFRKMPAWEDIYDQNQRMGVTAYILSREFSP